MLKIFLSEILFAMLMTITPLNAAATEGIPRIEIEATADTTSAVINCSAEITIPAGADRRVFLAGLELEKIRVNGEALDLGKSGPLFLKNDQAINLPENGKQQTVAVQYRYRPNQGELLGPDAIYLNGPWHPRLAGRAIFALKVTLPPGFHAISQAEEISEETSGEKVVSRFSFPHPLPGITLVAGPYEISRVKIENGPDLYAYFFPEDRDLVADYLKRGAEYIKRYQAAIGPFPYKRFSIVENRLPTGFAVDTFTLLGQQVVRLPFISATSLGHEILHQWFGNSVSVANESGNWCEGLATWLADQSYAADQDRGAQFRKNQILRYESFVNKNNAISLEQFIGGKSHLMAGQEANRAVGYAKASMLFEMLKGIIGDKAFFAGLRLFYQRFRGRDAQWSNLETVFSEASGKKLDTFFNGWLASRDIPKIKATGVGVREIEGRIHLSFDLRQEAKSSLVMSVPIRVITPTGTIEKRLTMTDKLFHVDLALDDYPNLLVIDPDYQLMRHLDHSETPPVWSRVMGAGKRIFVIASPEAKEKYAAFLARFKAANDEILDDGTADDRNLENGQLIFLDAGGNKARSLFGPPASGQHGFTLQVRENPLNPRLTATLITAKDPGEVAAAARKLSHYGKYSSLAFDLGRMKEEKVTDKAMGLRYRVLPEPVGEEVRPYLSFSQVMKKIADRKVVYVGESHTSAADHHLQIRVIRAMYRQDKNLAIGMEMFSHEAQKALDRYIIEKKTDEKTFLKESNYFRRWGYDFRFYRPILDFARANAIPVIALNQPKVVVSKVFGHGLASLSEEERGGLPEDRDLTLPGYRRRMNRVFHMHRGKGRLNNFLQAQAIWDETMADTAAKYLEGNPGSRMVIIAGRGHTEKNAIPPRLLRRTGLAQVVLLNDDPSGRAWDAADFVLATSAPKLPRPPLMGILLKEEKAGVRIVKVGKSSPAARAGVKKNDLILTADGEKIKAINDIKVIMLYKKKGETIRLLLKRKHILWPTTTGEIEIKL